MGGGAENPILIKDEEDIMTQYEPPNLGGLNLQDNKQTIIIDSSDSEPVVQQQQQLAPKGGKEKHALLRELKALGYTPRLKPDYTKPLDEPSWGDEDDEEDDEFDVDALSEEDDDDEMYEYQDMEEEREFLKREDDEDSDVDMKM